MNKHIIRDVSIQFNIFLLKQDSNSVSKDARLLVCGVGVEDISCAINSKQRCMYTLNPLHVNGHEVKNNRKIRKISFDTKTCLMKDCHVSFTSDYSLQ